MFAAGYLAFLRVLGTSAQVLSLALSPDAEASDAGLFYQACDSEYMPTVESTGT